jgi:hypothetical protein
MNKILLTFILFGIFPTAITAQTTRKTLKGKVIADANDIEGIYIINLKTQDATATQKGGYFSISVAVGDTLMLSSIQFKALRYEVTQTDLCKEDLLFLKMTPIMNQLNEVIVYQYKNINAEALGIIPRGQKTYTPAQRKLRTATGTDAQIGLNTAVTIDPLFNLFSGRTAMLKKELIVEGKETLLAKIDYMFENEYFTKKLKIPEEYVKGFQYYLVENNRFAAAINAKNKTLATFLMGEYAVKYLEIIAGENKK